MIKRWLFGQKFCAKALVSMGKGWAPVERHFWSGGLLTGYKINVIGLLLGHRFPKGGIVYLEDLQLNRLGAIETIKFTPHGFTPQFVWPKGLGGSE